MTLPPQVMDPFAHNYPALMQQQHQGQQQQVPCSMPGAVQPGTSVMQLAQLPMMLSPPQSAGSAHSMSPPHGKRRKFLLQGSNDHQNTCLLCFSWSSPPMAEGKKKKSSNMLSGFCRVSFVFLHLVHRDVVLWIHGLIVNSMQ
ncbi:unnamed protein product [Notodromas monacha]|uniref:Uncharacterized protein n=1 Tax=Notodromas monacha TaxID=399045 RepID=A0A7R9BGW1_9CRUS|nr:unnamed protein product [Notodromas monacha]CAG0913922.1 unnamed protein product [Notodromas monacha]